jgi:autotransporter translocation and assembly factor TamB
MALDVAVTRRNPLVVDNNIAYLNINPDLHVTGTLSRPIVTGRAVVESGTIEYGDRTFTVEKGVIDFLSPYKTDPSFDIVGDTQIRDWLITLQITGKPQNLDFTLSSNPSLEDADILSLLVTGKTASEFIKKEANPTQSAATMLTDIITSSIGKDIKKVTGLDVLKTETEIGDVPVSPENGSKTKTGLEMVKITVGKELSRRLKIEYSAEFDTEGFTQRAEADYQLLENTYLKGFQDSAGKYGGAIQYRLEFR